MVCYVRVDIANLIAVNSSEQESVSRGHDNGRLQLPQTRSDVVLKVSRGFTDTQVHFKHTCQY
jgi:hypothetical protein